MKGVAAWGWAVAAMGAYTLLWHNFWNPVLRLWNPLANQLFFLVGLALPWVAAILLARTRPITLRVGALMVVAVPSLWSAFWVMFASMEIQDTLRRGYDASFKPIAEVGTADGRLRAYRTDGGATTSVGVVIWQEHSVAPGVHRVRWIANRYPMYGARLERLPQQRVQVTWNMDDADFAGPLLTPDAHGEYHAAQAGR